MNWLGGADNLKPEALQKGPRLTLINERPYKTVSWSWYNALLFYFS